MWKILHIRNACWIISCTEHDNFSNHFRRETKRSVYAGKTVNTHLAEIALVVSVLLFPSEPFSQLEVLCIKSTITKLSVGLSQFLVKPSIINSPNAEVYTQESVKHEHRGFLYHSTET